MNASRIRVGVAVGFLGLALSSGTAMAQICTESQCDTTTTTAPTTTTTAPTTTTTAGDQLGTGTQNPPPGGETGGLPGGAEGPNQGVNPGEGANPDEVGESVTVGGGAQAAPEGTLPFTGGDVAGLVLIGGAAIGAGALLLRRSKTATA